MPKVTMVRAYYPHRRRLRGGILQTQRSREHLPGVICILHLDLWFD